MTTSPDVAKLKAKLYGDLAAQYVRLARAEPLSRNVHGLLTAADVAEAMAYHAVHPDVPEQRGIDVRERRPA